jgi:hypothetical protein
MQRVKFFQAILFTLFKSALLNLMLINRRQLRRMMESWKMFERCAYKKHLLFDQISLRAAGGEKVVVLARTSKCACAHKATQHHSAMD